MTDATSAQAAVQLILGLGLLASVAANIATVAKGWKRQPTIDQTLAADYVRLSDFGRCQERCKVECARLDARQDAANREIFGALRQQNAEIGAKLDNLQSELSRWQIGISSQVGNLDGRVNRLEREG